MLKHTRKGYTGGGPTETFPIRLKGMVERAVDNTRMPVEEVWRLVFERYETTHAAPESGSQVADEALVATLKEGGLTEGRNALALLGQKPGTPVPSGLLMDAIERHYRQLRQTANANGIPNREQMREYQQFVRAALPLMSADASVDVCSRIYTLYVEDITQNMESVFGDPSWAEVMVPLVAAAPGPERRERLESLFTAEGRASFGNSSKRAEFFKIPAMAVRALVDISGEDIDALLEDMLREPDRFRLRTPMDRAAVETALSERGRKEGQSALEEKTSAQAAPPVQTGFETAIAFETRRKLSRQKPEEEALRMLMEQYQRGDKAALYEFERRVSPGSPLGIQLLQEVEITDAARIIARKLPDPVFIPALQTALKRKVSTDLLLALGACGDREQGARYAVAALEAPPNATDAVALFQDLSQRVVYAQYVGAFADKAGAPVLERLVDGRALEPFFAAADIAFRDQGYRRRDAGIILLRQAALLGLTRLTGETSLPALKAAYADEHPGIRFIAAWGLYFLGDDTGHDLIEAYAEGDPDVPGRNCVFSAGWTGANDLLPAISYLRSPRIDAILLRRLQTTLDYNNEALLEDAVFCRDHEATVLPALLAYLESRDAFTRRGANNALKRITGQDFGFDPDQSPQMQPNTLNQWRAEVNNRLSKTSSVAER